MEIRTILVLGSRSPVSLELARSFSSAGHVVYAADTVRYPITRWSRGVKKYFELTSPVDDFMTFASQVVRLVETFEISDLIPVNEEVFYISSLKDKLSCKVWTSDFELIKSFHRKDAFIQLASPFFSVPETSTLIEQMHIQNSEKFVFKPIYSRFATNIYLRPQSNEIEHLLASEDWVVQEYIEGEEYCVYSIFDKGNLKALSIYKPLARIGKGAGIYLQSTKIDRLKKQVEQFGKAFTFTGQLSFDFIARNDKYYAIECNPRGTSGAHFVGKKLVDAFITDKPILFEDSKRALKLVLLGVKPVLFFSKACWKAKDFVWDRKDPGPSFLQFLSVFEFLVRAIKTRKSPLSSTSADIEYDGQQL